MTTPLLVVDNPRDCSCARCTSACRQRPGWFLPGEAERAAAHLGLTLQELFESKLGVDYDSDPDVFLLSPATTSMEPGAVFPYDPRGRCVFLTDDERCSIHAVKPFECRTLYHDDHATVEERHEAVGLAWRDHQEQIASLFGSEPSVPEHDLFDTFSLMFGR